MTWHGIEHAPALCFPALAVKPARAYPAAMKRFLAALALTVLALLPVRLAADPADIAAASRAVVRVVLISQDQDGVGLVGHGSGFAVSPTLVVTNAHVVAPMAGNPNMRVGLVPSQGKTG